jgi:hypothetical protein
VALFAERSSSSFVTMIPRALEAATRPKPSLSPRRTKAWSRGQPQARHYDRADHRNQDMESIVPKEIGTTEVRQGRTPHIVRYVLAISLTAAIVALAVVWVVMVN